MKLTRQQMNAALEKAARERRDREARGDRTDALLDEWPDGPPLGDEQAMLRYSAALRQWCDARGIPYGDGAGD
jgi:hypothetical protein